VLYIYIYIYIYKSALLRPGFDTRPFMVGFVVCKPTLRQVSLRVLPFSPVIMKPPALHTHPYLDITLMKRLSGQSLETFNTKAVLSDKGQDWTEASTFTTWSADCHDSLHVCFLYSQQHFHKWLDLQGEVKGLPFDCSVSWHCFRISCSCHI